ncbi:MULTISPECIES: hypothetical protein [unclassified Levilactobacillus]|uniref:hypothetical protein n=1 Tax=unclassified Levilactobacillus TaxID=2767918 RepID=UPI002FEE7848
MKNRENAMYERLDHGYTKLAKESQSEADGFLLFAYLLVRKYADFPMHVTSFYDNERKCQTFIAEFQA